MLKALAWVWYIISCIDPLKLKWCIILMPGVLHYEKQCDAVWTLMKSDLLTYVKDDSALWTNNSKLSDFS